MMFMVLGGALVLAVIVGLCAWIVYGGKRLLPITIDVSAQKAVVDASTIADIKTADETRNAAVEKMKADEDAKRAELQDDPVALSAFLERAGKGK